MELALRQISTHRQQEICIRIKLQFENHGILSSKQFEDGLSASWFLLRPQLRCISDLAADIFSAFHLHKSCPHGITLRMENFTLPPSQPISLLKDKDIVNVLKRTTSSDLVDGRLKDGTSSSLSDFDIGSRGIKLYAPEEFERETGGYESEKEEEPQRMKTNVTNGASEKKKQKHAECQRDTDLIPLKSKKKKRKRTTSERDSEQDRDFKLQVVPYAADGFPNKVESSKKKKRIDHCYEENGVLKSPREKNVKVNESLKVHRKESKTKGLVEAKANVVNVDQTNSQKDVTQDSHSTSSSSEGSSHDQGTPEETKTVKKLSRSTLRKKAKRRWKREQKQMLVRNTASAGNNQSWSVLAKKNDDDGEAEEEQLPIVVRPGHIRFEPLDEDNDDNGHTQQNNLSINWNEGMSKRKGQSWGQEKSRRGNRNQIEDIETESSASEAMDSESQPIQYETLPCLKRSPQKGDIIAYRMLELTSNLCPGVSEFRVGEVVEVDTASGSLELGKIPENSLKRLSEGRLGRTENREEIIQLVLADLVDVRLVEGSLCAAQSNSFQVEAPPTSCPIDDIKICHTDHMEVEKSMNIQTSSCTNDFQAIALSKPKSPPVQDIPSAWIEISETLERRKEELAREEKQDTSKEGCELTGGDTSKNKKIATPRQNRTWIRRAGGLGTTMALLRSQMSSELS